MMQSIDQLRQFEGRRVCVALADGSRLEDCRLVSAGRGLAKTVWILTGGMDVFLPLPDVKAIWETVSDPDRFAA
jgi:hypothetical protein